MGSSLNNLQSVCIFVQGRLYTISFPIAIPNCKLVAILCYETFLRAKNTILNRLRCLQVAAAHLLALSGEQARPQRRAFVESGVANAVFLHDSTRENGIPERPQTLRYSKIINIFSLIYAQSNAERIPNRPTRQESCGLFYPFSGTKPTRSLTTSPPMIRPATEGTKALEPGTVRRAVHLR